MYVMFSISFKPCCMSVSRSSVLQELCIEVRIRFVGCAMSDVATVASTSETDELVELTLDIMSPPCQPITCDGFRWYCRGCLVAGS